MSTIDFTHLSWFKPNVRHLGVENLRVRLSEDFLFAAPAAAFQEQSVDIGTVFCAGLKIVFLGVTHDFELEIDLIDRDHMLSSIVLLDTCQETLGEEETGYPEGLGSTVFNPILHELETLDKVKNPGCKRLK